MSILLRILPSHLCEADEFDSIAAAKPELTKSLQGKRKKRKKSKKSKRMPISPMQVQEDGAGIAGLSQPKEETFELEPQGRIKFFHTPFKFCESCFTL